MVLYGMIFYGIVGYGMISYSIIVPRSLLVPTVGRQESCSSWRGPPITFRSNGLPALLSVDGKKNVGFCSSDRAFFFVVKR